MAPLGSGTRKGLARSSGYCQLIHSRRPPTSPSGTLKPSPEPIADGSEDLLDTAESDAADEMHVVRLKFRHAVHRSSPVYRVCYLSVFYVCVT